MRLEALTSLGGSYGSCKSVWLGRAELREKTNVGAVLCTAVGPNAKLARQLEKVLGVGVPLSSSTVVEGQKLRVLWLSPKSWIVLCTSEMENELVETISAAFSDHAVLASRFSDALCWLSLEGVAAEDLLRQGSFLSFSAEGIRVGYGKRTLVAGIPALILREADTCWTVGVERSRASYFFDWLSGLTKSFAENSK